MMNIKRNKYKYLGVLALTATLSACDHDDTDNEENVVVETPHVFELTLMNITQGQIFSPAALTTHATGMKLWEAGLTASFALENLAESGASGELIALSGIEQSQIGSSAIQPGEAYSWTVELKQDDGFSVSLATMLINTNDGFTGITDMDISALALGDSYQKTLMVYDAGTEANDEIAVPGVGGEAFNASRIGDVDRVAVHAGVLTENELSGSLLSTEHKFDNPAAKLIIKRVQ